MALHALALPSLVFTKYANAVFLNVVARRFLNMCRVILREDIRKYGAEEASLV